MKKKHKGIIIYSKRIKDNDLYIRILSYNDQIDSGIVYGGNSSKKKIIYQIGFFVEYFSSKKNENGPFTLTAEITKPFLLNIFTDKYKLNAHLSIISLINLSIVEGQNIHGFYKSVNTLVDKIINKQHWIYYYCEWLFDLLKLIGYEIDYKNNYDKKYFDIYNQHFTFDKNTNSMIFPHKLFLKKNEINFKNINLAFMMFENIFSKNHLENLNYKLPLNFINFKKMILLRLNV